MAIEINVELAKVEGRFRLQKFSADGELLADSGFGKNLITDYAMNRLMGQGRSPFSRGTAGLGPTPARLVVGSGNTTPAYTDTACEAPLAGLTSPATPTYGNTGAPDYACWVRLVYTFAIGAVAGNIAEICLVDGTTNTSPALTRALHKDDTGNPVVFPITLEEQLVVTYEGYSYPNLNDITGTFDIDVYDGATFVETINHSYTARCCYVQSYKTDSSTSESTSGVGVDNYAPALRTIDHRAANFRLSQTQTLPATTVNSSFVASSNPLQPRALAMEVSTESYVAESFAASCTAKWAAAAGNYAGGIGTISFGYAPSTGSTTGRWWAVSIDPPIAKDATKTLEITFNTSVGRA